MLRPHEHGPAADVRDRLPVEALWRSRRIEEIMRTRQGRAVNDWQFGDQQVRTKVFVLVPTEVDPRRRGASIPLQLARRRSHAAAGSVRRRGAAGGPLS